MPFAIITTLLFVYYVLPKIKPSITLALLSLIFIVRIGYILNASHKFVDRKEWTFATLEKMKKQDITKGYLYSTALIDNLLLMNWGTPTESLLASALSGDKPTHTFVVDNPDGIKRRMTTSNKEIISCFGTLNFDVLNDHYFQIDTTSSYKLIN